MSRPIPIIVCGATQKVAATVKSNMLPEYDVVYAGHDLPSSLREVPLILAGTPPPATSLHTQLGSNDFSAARGPPRAVVTGGGYGDDAFRDLFGACVAACGGSESDLPVPFYRVDNAITARLAAEGRGPPLPNIGGGPAAVPGTEDYSKAIAGRLKVRIREVEEGGEAGKVFSF